MGIVKYSGPVASFHCPTEATIRSLKVHFSPKQEGSGDPSPENVRGIVGWDGVEVHQSGKNLFNPETVTMNMEIGSDGNPLATGSSNRWCITNFIPVKPNTTYIAKALLTAGSGRSAVYDINKEKVSTKMEVLGADAETVISTGSTGHYVRLTVRIADGLSTIFEESSSATAYEPYHGSTINYEFGVLGKNKFNWDVPVSESSPVSSDATTAREFTLDTYIIGMSVNNYYRQNYVNWVLNPSVENGVISFSSGGASGYGIAFPLKLAAGQTYFLSGTGNGAVGATYYNENGELISYQNGRLNKTITIPDNTATTLIGFYASASNTEFSFSNIQLELGDTATTYESYDPNKTVYGGWVDLITGEVQQEYDKIILDGSFNPGIFPWAADTEDEDGTIITHALYLKRDTYDNKHKRDAGAYCDQLQWYNINNVRNKIGFGMYDGSSYSACLMLPKELVGDTNETLNSYLSANPITIVSELETPITYYLPPHSTILQTFLAQNNVWSNADYVEVEYDLHETQTILARKQFIMASQPHIVKPAAAPLQNFVTDMAAPLKNCKVYFSPVQDTSNGAPSPDNIYPISGWTGVDVYKAGENLIPIDYAPVEGKWKPTNGVISGSVYNMGQFPVPATMLYYQVGTTGNPYFGFIDGEIKSGEPVYGVKTVTNVRGTSFDNSDGHKYALITATSESILDNEIVISVGQGVKPYSEPSGTTLPIDWSSAGTVYGGYVDLVTGEVWETYHKIILDGVTINCKANRDYSDSTNIIGGVVYLQPMGEADGQYSTKLLCDSMPILAPNEALPTDYPFIRTISAGGQYLRIYVAATAEHTDLDTAAKRIAFVNEYLAEHPTTVVYPLATPTLVTTLTPTALKTLRGTNNIWASNGGDNIEIAYWKH